MVIAQKPVESAEHAKQLICDLGAHFYNWGWVSGTGGGISIKHEDKIYMAPSGVLKEALTPEMIFTLDAQGDVLTGPAPESGMTVSQCHPLFIHAYNKRGAGAVLHSHSKWAVLASLIATDGYLEIHELEMLKGIKGVGYHDRHRVPVITNTAYECDLADSLAEAMDAYPEAQCVVVERHGVYAWGDDWVSAKRHAECYDFLFNAVVEMKRLGLS